MSYILDALKKLEQEKSRKSRAVGKINITGELLGSERSRPSEGRNMKIILIVSLAVLVTFGATLFFLKGKGGRDRVSARTSITQPAPSTSAPSPVPAPVPAVQPLPVQQIPLVPPQVAVAPVPAPVTTQPAVSEDDLSDDEGRERRRRHHKIPQSAASPQSQESTALKSGPAPADIKVSGIAWQDERRARRAVVNGFLLREGAVVSGAKITEILQDRVRFSLSGTTFEVTFISAGTQGTGK